MRILHVIPTYVPAYRYGGPLRSVYGLAEAQSRAGDVVEVFATNVDGPGRLEVPIASPVPVGRHHVRYFQAGWPRRMCRAPGMARQLEREVARFDLFHLHSVFLWPTWASARRARREGRPYVVSPRGMLVRDLIQRRGSLRKRLWIALVERRNLASAARIVVTSATEAEELRAMDLALAPVVEVPNGVDLAEFESRSGEGASAEVAAATSGGAFALAFGRLSWKKGLDCAIEALARLPKGRLVIAGPDDEGLGPRLTALAVKRGVAERVTLLGELRGADRTALLRAARVLVLPSASENFGNVILEALACEVPAVVSPAVGLAAAVASAGAGAVVEPAAGPIAAALEPFLESVVLARAAGARGRRLVTQSYTWDAVARRMREMYSEVLTS